MRFELVIDVDVEFDLLSQLLVLVMLLELLMQFVDVKPIDFVTENSLIVGIEISLLLLLLISSLILVLLCSQLHLFLLLLPVVVVVLPVLVVVVVSEVMKSLIDFVNQANLLYYSMIHLVKRKT